MPANDPKQTQELHATRQLQGSCTHWALAAYFTCERFLSSCPMPRIIIQLFHIEAMSKLV